MTRTTPLAALATLAALTVPVALPAAAAGAAESCDGRTATITAAPGTPVVGTPGDDVIVGTPGRDTIDGAGGNDTVCGLAGADTIVGGDGDDRLFGGLDDAYVPDDGYYGDLVVPGLGDDHVDLGSDPAAERLCVCDIPVWDQVSFAGAPTGVVVELGLGRARGEGTDTIAVPEEGRSAGIVGSPHDDTLAGSAADELVDAGGGNDTVVGFGGSDSIHVDREGRTSAGQWPETAPERPGHDRAYGGDDGDLVSGSTGTDRLKGGSGRDHLRTTSVLPGSVLQGGTGADVLFGRLGAVLRGGSGRDELHSQVAPGTRQSLHGGAGEDVLRVSVPRSAFEPGWSVVVDAARDRIRIDGRRVATQRSTETVHLSLPRGRATFLGSAGRDGFGASSRVRVRAFGRGGPDRLAGGRFDDLLDGGPGRDTLYGGPGHDRCLHGEQVQRCEAHA